MKYVLVVPGRYTFQTSDRFRMFNKLSDIHFQDEWCLAMKKFAERPSGDGSVFMIVVHHCILFSFVKEGVRIDPSVLELDKSRLGSFLVANKRKLRASCTHVYLRGTDEVLWNDFGLALHPNRMWGTAYRTDCLILREPERSVAPWEIVPYQFSADWYAPFASE